MLVLTIRTDKPEAEIGLFEGQQKIAYERWEAHRQLAETLHTRIDLLLKQHHKTWKDIQGVVGYQGPGSFTGLRIGLSVANALATSEGIPLIGASGDQWCQDGIKRLLSGENQKVILPEYGAPVHITQQKK